MDEQSRETPAEHRSGEPVGTKLLRIAARARKEPKLKFVNLFYLMKGELLLECFRRSESGERGSRMLISGPPVERLPCHHENHDKIDRHRQPHISQMRGQKPQHQNPVSGASCPKPR